MPRIASRLTGAEGDAPWRTERLEIWCRLRGGICFRDRARQDLPQLYALLQAGGNITKWNAQGEAQRTRSAPANDRN